MSAVPLEYLNSLKGTNPYQSTPGTWNQLSNSVNLPSNPTGIGPYIPVNKVSTQPIQSGGNGGGSNTPSVPSMEDQLRSQISSGWDSYINSLSGQLGSLGDQRTAQEGQIGSQYQQGVNTLDLQRNQGITALDNQTNLTTQNQAKTLQDLAGNIRNSMQAGNTYLGSLGAGDSSAANQYSYALTKLGTQQRTGIQNNVANILHDIETRKQNVQDTYNTSVNNLALQRDQALQGVAQWFAQAQQQIQQMQAQGQLGKNQDLNALSQNILNQALTRLNAVQTQATQAKAALDNNFKTQSAAIADAASRIGSQSSASYTQPQFSPVVGTPQVTQNGGLNVPSGFGQSNDNKQNFLQSLGINPAISSIYGY